MARPGPGSGLHRVDRTDDEQQADAAAAYYRERLLEPAVRPWTDDHPLKPITLGPTWQIGSDGRWVLPELSLGWEVLGFLSTHLNARAIGREDRYEFTLEQARFILHWYAVRPDGTWVYRDAVMQRVKGHGKDPLLAAISTNVLVGPDEVVDVDEKRGIVHGRQVTQVLVQLAAVSQEQTKTTMQLFPALFTDEFRHKFGIMPPGKTQLDARNGVAHLDAVTSSPAKLEGFRPRLTVGNETHWWLAGNNGHEMDAVTRRNKNKNAQARSLKATNAFAPGRDSIAERDREAYEAGDLPEMLYDTVEAPRHAELNAKHGEIVVPMVRGDSTWLTTQMFVGALEDPRDPDSTKRRFWYNQVQASEETWLDPQVWKDIAPAPDEELIVLPGERIVVFGDGSKSDDATALVGCRISDGLVFFLGVWQRPPGLTNEQRALWRVNRDDVDAKVAGIMDTYNVAGFWFDPSDVLDDEDGSSYWTPYCDIWHTRYGTKMPLKPTGITGSKHSVIYDMRTPQHQKEFTEASMQFVNDADRGDFQHDGHPLLRRHVANAVKNLGKYGVSLQKESRESPKKIDLAVCAVGARYMRRLVVTGGKKLAQRSGRVV